ARQLSSRGWHAQQTAANDVGLNLRGSLEDIQDASIAQDAADFVLQGVAVPAMNLYSCIRVAPGDSCSQQFGHARLDVAPGSGILGSGGRIGQLSGNDLFDRHEGKFVRDARETDQRLAELAPLEGVGQSELQRLAGNADGTGGGLNPRTFKCLHELAKTCPLAATEQALCTDFELIE